MLSKEQLEKIANPVPADIGGTQNLIVTEMAIELLSLREQLAELKALPASGYLWLKNGVAINCLLREPSMSDPYWEDRGFSYEPLFTAAKPAED
ncbi:hypothetical protein [Yersinia kristensenii]|uniref:hypothetical protein n=1 Tax=Yersinia kristensenii TaxID=28152 RepID=UPI0005E6681B|nr:hypothetical protein [Yersinia kristensenii]CNK93719.1 Uncharacterised protein [Yersinia kristensenii]